MTSTTLIASGRALFELPNGRFDQITREPLKPICWLAIARNAEWERMGLILTRTSTGFTEAHTKEKSHASRAS